MSVDNGDYHISPVLFNSVVVTIAGGDANLTDRIMTGRDEGGSSTVPNPVAAQTVPACGRLTATAFLNGVALSQQPSFKWYSSNPNVATVDSNGNVSRTPANPNAASFDSNSTPSTSQIGGLIQIRAVALRADGSESGVEGTFTLAVQAAGFGWILKAGGSPGPANPRSSTGATGFLNLVGNPIPPNY